MFVHADVRHEDDVRNLVDETVKRFGRLDIAVNSAGTEGLGGLVTEQTAESYAATFDSNVLGGLTTRQLYDRRDRGRRRRPNRHLAIGTPNCEESHESEHRSTERSDRS
jgi:NAD(P)-dependent dehydrogenase (short-subunit alcohol dehydrogenase family)